MAQIIAIITKTEDTYDDTRSQELLIRPSSNEYLAPLPRISLGLKTKNAFRGMRKKNASLSRIPEVTNEENSSFKEMTSFQ